MVDESMQHAPARQSLRERRRKETADLILDGTLELMTRAAIDGITMDAVAEHVGVSLRTLYRYFPDRGSLLAASLARHNESVPFEPPKTPEQIGAVYGATFPRFDDVAPIVQAVLAARVAGSLRWEARTQRIREIEAALVPACHRLPRQEAEEATAVIVYLANALAWLSLRDESGLDGQRSGTAITWAIDTLVSDLQRRNLERARAEAPDRSSGGRRT
jgi:AcrR family transcriptional regulator